jgi:deoxyribodipyrimidine photolyase-related protein
MSRFLERIASVRPTKQQAKARRWIYLPYDRLTDRTGPLHATAPSDAGLILVESAAKGHRREYHKKKIALLLANERHFALEQATRGVAILYITEQGTHGDGLLKIQREFDLPAITLMKPAERELRIDLDHASKQGLKLNEVEDTTWLSTESDFDSVFKLKPGADLPRAFVMDRFYRAMRKKTGILMQQGEPVGGSFSYDAENRQPYKGQVPVPRRPIYQPDEITQEVLELVAQEYPHNFGTLDGFDFPVTAEDCRTFWKFALTKLLPTFGPYEDAMRDDELDLFHSKTSALVNLSRILPSDLVNDTAAAYAKGKIPLASAEGFIRQVLGWREFMRHLHRVTDGYRNLPKTDSIFIEKKRGNTGSYAGATPSALQAIRPLPAAYWGAKSGLHCLDTVVEQVIHEGWSHHITRLMVLSNLATLCGFSPRELTDWFWFAYVDAYDWVVEPNVLGMSTYADGGLTATKPYVSGAAYINRMSNYCGHCQYDPKKSTGPGSCPFTALYWTFLERNQERLGSNIRLAMPYTTLRKKSPEERKALRERADEAMAMLESSPYKKLSS